MLDLLPHIVNGLVLGLLFALIALGFMLIVGLMEQINLAHGSLFALGAYLALQLTGPKPPLPGDLANLWLQMPLGWRYALALLIAPCIAGIVGIAVEVCMRRTYGKDPLYGLLLTFGAALVIEEGIRLVWGTRDYVLPVPQAVSGGFLFNDLIWSTYRFYAAGIAVAVIGLVWLLIEKTPYGAMIKLAHTTARWCARSASTCRDCGLACSCSAPCWPRSPASSWHPSGVYVRTWAWMPSCRLSSSSCWAGSGASGVRSSPVFSWASPSDYRVRMPRSGRCFPCTFCWLPS